MITRLGSLKRISWLKASPIQNFILPAKSPYKSKGNSTVGDNMEFVPKLFNREGTLKYSLNTPLHTVILCQALEL